MQRVLPPPRRELFDRALAAFSSFGIVTAAVRPFVEVIAPDKRGIRPRRYPGA